MTSRSLKRFANYAKNAMMLSPLTPKKDLTTHGYFPRLHHFREKIIIVPVLECGIQSFSVGIEEDEVPM